MSYNLNELAGQDYFLIVVDEHNYRMSYPSAIDLLELETIDTKSAESTKRLEAISVDLLSEQDETVRVKLVKEADKIQNTLQNETDTMLDWCIKYIKPEALDAPDFKTLLMGKSVKYLLAFMNIIRQELK